MGESDHAIIEVDLSPRYAEHLAEPRASLSREREQQAVGLVDSGEKSPELICCEHSLRPLVLEARPLEAVEQGDRAWANEPEMTACVFVDGREHG